MTKLTWLLVILGCSIAIPVAAGGLPQPIFYRLPLGTTNADLRTYTAGNNYPVGPTSITVGGVPFDLVAFNNVPNSLGVVQATGPGQQIAGMANIFGTTTLYTLINSKFGQFGALNAIIECFGAGGSYAAFDVVQGVNIRDHFAGDYNNIATEAFPNDYGPVHLDRQTFVLPAAFANDTLTQIRFQTVDAGVPQGQPFLAALTVETIPEPTTAVLFAGATLLILRTVRRRRSDSPGEARGN